MFFFFWLVFCSVFSSCASASTFSSTPRAAGLRVQRRGSTPGRVWLFLRSLQQRHPGVLQESKSLERQSSRAQGKHSVDSPCRCVRSKVMYWCPTICFQVVSAQRLVHACKQISVSHDLLFQMVFAQRLIYACKQSASRVSCEEANYMCGRCSRCFLLGKLVSLPYAPYS